MLFLEIIIIITIIIMINVVSSDMVRNSASFKVVATICYTQSTCHIYGEQPKAR